METVSFRLKDYPYLDGFFNQKETPALLFMPISVTRWMNFANQERPGEIHPPYWHLMQDQAVSNQAGACWPLCELLLHCCPQKPVRSHCICSLGHWGTNKQRRWPQGLPQLFCRSSDFYLTTASSDDRQRLWQAVEIHSCQKGSAAGKAALALTERKGKERAEAAVNCAGLKALSHVSALVALSVSQD